MTVPRRRVVMGERSNHAHDPTTPLLVSLDTSYHASSPLLRLSEQLTSLFHGHALWEPDPTNVYPHVSIGDVGYVREGHFCRLFNVLLEWDHPSNRTFVQPEPYTRLDVGPFTNIRELVFPRGDYYSRNVIRSHETEDLRAEGSSDEYVFCSISTLSTRGRHNFLQSQTYQVYVQ